MKPARPQRAPRASRDLSRVKPQRTRPNANSKADRAVLGARVSIYWPSMKERYFGTITHVDPEDEALTVTYDDGEEFTYEPNFKG